MSKTLEKRYPVRFYCLDDNSTCTAHKTEKELVEIDQLVRMGGLSIYPGKGYFWRYETLKEAMERLHNHPQHSSKEEEKK